MDEIAGQPDHLSYMHTYVCKPLQIQPTPLIKIPMYVANSCRSVNPWCDKVVLVYAPVFALCVMCCVYDDLLCVFLADLYFL